MAFFDDLGKKITQTGQGAMQKTKNLGETLKLNGQISDEEKRVNDLFYQIGKSYFEQHSNDAEAFLIPMIEGIKASKKNIISLHEQLRELKGVSNCPKCGGEVPLNAPFCGTCGCNVSVAAQQTHIPGGVPCINCGNTVAPGAAFCTKCGYKIIPEAPVQPGQQS